MGGKWARGQMLIQAAVAVIGHLPLTPPWASQLEGIDLGLQGSVVNNTSSRSAASADHGIRFPDSDALAFRVCNCWCHCYPVESTWTFL